MDVADDAKLAEEEVPDDEVPDSEAMSALAPSLGFAATVWRPIDADRRKSGGVGLSRVRRVVKASQTNNSSTSSRTNVSFGGDSAFLLSTLAILFELLTRFSRQVHTRAFISRIFDLISFSFSFSVHLLLC